MTKVSVVFSTHDSTCGRANMKVNSPPLEVFCEGKQRLGVTFDKFLCRAV